MHCSSLQTHLKELLFISVASFLAVCMKQELWAFPIYLLSTSFMNQAATGLQQ